MKIASAILLFTASLALGATQEGPSTKTAPNPSIGLEVGIPAPAFSLRDQFGREQTNQTLRSTNGTVILFFRSADWWPFCKGQLVQLQAAKTRFEAQGLKLAAISYDSDPILKDFAQRHKIDFPLLADPNSEVIRKFQVLNVEAKGMTKGMAYPGYFYIDPNGTVRGKYFEEKYTNRLTANNVIGKLFPELTEEVSQTVDAPHLRLTLSQSDLTAFPGSRVTLTAEITLPPNVHVYSPGVQGYKPIKLVLHASRGFEPASVNYPASKTLYLQAIKEQVPVFDGHFKITQDVTVSASKVGDGARALFALRKTLEIEGELQYQACDKTVCYPPTSVPVKWELKILPLDLKRSPKAIQRKDGDR